MSGIHTTAGTTLSIGAAPATLDAAGFGAVSYTLVGEIIDLGSYGTTYNEVKYTAVGTRGTKKFKGSYDNGSMQLKMGYSTSDVGQIAMKAALASDNSYSIKVVMQDGHINYFTAKVMSYTTTLSTVDTITGADTTLAIDSSLVEV